MRQTPFRMNAQLLTPKKTLIAICAYNEGGALPSLLPLLEHRDVLVVDDGSSDNTRDVVIEFGVRLLVHPRRMGKSWSEQDIIDYAKKNDYEYVLEIGADALPSRDAIPEILMRLQEEGVGGVSIKQIPVGPHNVSYYIDDLIWAVLNHGKSIQMARRGTCHPGGVMYGFKTEYITKVVGSINDDEQLGMLLRMHGQRTVFVSTAAAYFDASSGVDHIFERRRRMIVGHYVYQKSSAPGMQHRVAAEAMIRAIIAKPSRIAWVFPALVIEVLSRARAFRDARRPEVLSKYATWVTTHKKNTVKAANE
jgi:glycosyltransferase involved in cell wall biosynthesis